MNQPFLVDPSDILPVNTHYSIILFPSREDAEFLHFLTTHLGKFYNTEYEYPFEPHVLVGVIPRIKPDGSSFSLEEVSELVSRAKERLSGSIQFEIKNARTPSDERKQPIALEMEPNSTLIKLREFLLEQNPSFTSRSNGESHMTLVNQLADAEKFSRLKVEEEALQKGEWLPWSQQVAKAMGGTIQLDRIQIWAAPVVTKSAEQRLSWQKLTQSEYLENGLENGSRKPIASSSGNSVSLSEQSPRLMGERSVIQA